MFAVVVLLTVVVDIVKLALVAFCGTVPRRWTVALPPPEKRPAGIGALFFGVAGAAGGGAVGGYLASKVK